MLRDADLADLVKDPAALVSFDPARLAGDLYDKNSPIQPSSLDLSIGKVLVPELDSRARGGFDNPETKNFSLAPGSTAIVETAEALDLPSDIAGIAFPPTEVSAAGILMTNPGHVDPGYQGTLKFTIINMSHEAFDLEAHNNIATILFFRLSQGCEKNWIQRGHAPNPEVRKNQFDRLSKDFLNVKKRSRQEAWDVILKGGLATVVLSLLATVVTIALMTGSATNGQDNLVAELNARVTALNREVGVLQNQKDVVSLEQRIAQLQRKVSALEREIVNGHG